MAYSGTTTHYGLPKYVSTDKPSWLDTNDGFDAIDQALYAAAQAVDPAQIAQMQNDITALQTGKQNVLTFDATPTNGSVNPVTSGGVYDAINKGTVEVTGNGVKTVSQLLTDLMGVMNTAKINENSVLELTGQYFHLVTKASGSIIFTRSYATSSNFGISTMFLQSAPAYYLADRSSNSDKSSDVVASGDKIILHY